VDFLRRLIFFVTTSCPQFDEVVTYLKARVPGITIVTDIICGFPTETEEDFQVYQP
jgi:tRNA A37 methylthiotransferase MiaB